METIVYKEIFAPVLSSPSFSSGGKTIFELLCSYDPLSGQIQDGMKPFASVKGQNKAGR